MTKARNEASPSKTALVVGSVLTALAAWNFYRGRAVAWILAGLGVALLLTGLFLPPVARRFHALWMRVAAVLGFVNTRIILCLMYYGVMTPFGLILRAAGRDPLERRRKRRDGYWKPRKLTRQTKQGFEQSF